MPNASSISNSLEAYHAAALDDHLGALQCMVDLAGAYRALAQYSRAAEYYDGAIAGISARLSADHPIALSARLVRAINLPELGRNEEAEDAFRDIVERFGRILGPFHPDTLRGHHELRHPLRPLRPARACRGALPRRPSRAARRSWGSITSIPCGLSSVLSASCGRRTAAMRPRRSRCGSLAPDATRRSSTTCWL